MRPAIILARVSSVEQEEGHSLDAQLANLHSYAARNEFEVIQVYRIIESSTKGHRPEFERMIDFIRKQKKRTALIVDCVDRLQRSFTHTPVLNVLMEKDVLEIHFVREGNVIDKNATSMQKLMWNMGTVMAQSYTDQLTDNIRRSIKHKLAKGEWIAMAPLGYLNSTDPATGRSTVTIDPKRAPLVQRLFAEYSSGVSSMSELRKKSQEWGLLGRKNTPLCLQTIADILGNPFYCGMMRIKGHLYPHTYPQLVAHEVYRECEKRKRNPQQAVRITRYPFLLRGLITCAVSERKVTCSLQKGRYVYLTTRDPEDKNKVLWIKEEVVVKQIQDVLENFKLPEELLAKIIDYIKLTHEAEKESHYLSLKDVRIEHSNITQKLNKLMDLLIEGHIEQKAYKDRCNELNFRRNELDCLLGSNDRADEIFKEALEKVLTLVSKSHYLFGSSKIEYKRDLIGFVFSNLKLEGATLRYTLRKPFELFAQLPKNPEWCALVDSNH